MDKTKIEIAFEKVLRFFYYGTMIPVVIIMLYFAGWVWGGLSGICLTWLVNAITGRDYSQQFNVVFPLTGKIFGAVVGICAARFMFRR